MPAIPKEYSSTMTIFQKKILLAVWLPAALLSALNIDAQNPSGRPAPARAPSTVGSQGPLPEHAKFTGAQIDAGGTLFLQNCAFCHGKDAGGGESGPDLTRSKLV